MGDKLGCFLVQLPPSLQLDAAIEERSFQDLRARSPAAIACEPRHPSWFDESADDLLASLHVARVAANPARSKSGAIPDGDRMMTYCRLHGSPRTYYSAYTEHYITSLASRIKTDRLAGRLVWCIFDNTALGAATLNALDLLGRLAAT